MTLTEYLEYREEVKEFLSGSGNNNTSQLNEDIRQFCFNELGSDEFNKLENKRFWKQH